MQGLVKIADGILNDSGVFVPDGELGLNLENL